MEQKIELCSNIMAAKGMTIAFAESATAGWLCSEFALAEKSGKVLKGGITCYDASLKESLLGVPHETIKRFTPESQEVTDELARRLPQLIPADIHVAITGLTTPGGSETPDKPVGTMFIAAMISDRLHRHRKVFSGDCERIIAQTIKAVADLLITALEPLPYRVSETNNLLNNNLTMKHPEDIIETQQTGRATDFVESREYNTIEEAHEGFKKAARRMLLVNEWHQYAGAGSAVFSLTNNQGVEADGFAQEGALFNISLPAPGPDAGDGLEWVMIERMEAIEDKQAVEEYLVMLVRPIPDPRKTDAEIAHFYKDVSTNTLVVKRKGKTVSAAVHGRNETANNANVDLHDKIRNTIVALGARVGLAGPQWKKLVKGFLE